MKIIAVDFDGTITRSDTFPNIGEPRWEVINFIKNRKALGDIIILYTCREGPELVEAVRTAQSWGIEFDYVNESCPERAKQFGYSSRKIGADLYIDDKSLNPIYEIDRLRKLERDAAETIDELDYDYGFY